MAYASTVGISSDVRARQYKRGALRMRVLVFRSLQSGWIAGVVVYPVRGFSA